MIEGFEDLMFSSDGRILNLLFSTSLYKKSYLNEHDLFIITHWCLKIAKTTNVIAKAYYNYKLSKKIEQLHETRVINLDYVSICAGIEITNLRKVVNLYKDNCRSSKFPFNLQSVKDGRIMLSKNKKVFYV